MIRRESPVLPAYDRKSPSRSLEIDIRVASNQNDVAAIPAKLTISSRDIGKNGAGPKQAAQYAARRTGRDPVGSGR